MDTEHAPTDNIDTAAAQQRTAMVEQLREMGVVRSPAVAAALATVPRHLFTPGATLEQAYAPNSAVMPKRDTRGAVTSTVSAAHIQAVMLDQADVEPGMNVLEIGSGGYNAALLAELVGVGGAVTSVDIDEDIIDRARTCLDGVGYPHVRTLVGDGNAGVPEYAPYDRIIVTVRAWDIPPAWVQQLTDTGRLVLPLQLRGLTRTFALDRSTDHGVLLQGDDVRLCSFVPMQGSGARTDIVVAIEPPGLPRIRLRTEDLDGPDLTAVAAAIAAAATESPVTLWTGVEFDHVDDLDLWLGLHLPCFGILHADGELTGITTPTPLTKAGAPALLAETGFAYRTKRSIPGTDRFETGVLGWGPEATVLAQQYADCIQAWGRYRGAGGTGPRIHVAPRGVYRAGERGEASVEKNHVRIDASWPTAAAPSA